MEDRLYFNDKDLRNAVMEFAEKYFYDFPLLIHDVYFGRKVLTTLGYTVPLKGIQPNDIVNQNLDEIDDKSKIIESDIEINGYFEGLNITETLLHEMCHSVNFTMGDYNANHGKLFKDVAEVISKRSGYNIHTTSSDDYLNAVLSSIEFIKKCKKEMESIVFRRKTLKNFIKYEDIYVKVIDELNDMYKGLGDVLADFVENGDVDDKEELDKCADKVDEILPKTQLRWWGFK